MSVREYIGARYVPLFSNPLQWDITKDYEPLTIVTNAGDSYTSMQTVPAGIEVTNTEYWALTGSYNAQIEQYRRETQAAIDAIDEVQQGVTKNSGDITALNQSLDLTDEDVLANTNAISNVFTKSESDARYVSKFNIAGSVLGCIGDSILAGWSPENPSNVKSWDKYLAENLGIDANNVYASGIGGSGFASGATFASQVTTLKENMLAAGVDINKVDNLVIGGGINDVRNNIPSYTVRENTTSLCETACEAFPNATIHIFPMIIANRGLNDRLIFSQNAVVEGCQSVSSMYLKRVVCYTGCWSWNYDGNDDGCSSDNIHLLTGGLKRVASSMCLEMNGGSAYREGFSVPMSNAQDGGALTLGYRRGTLFTFTLQTNITSINVGGNNVAIGLDRRYGAGTAISPLNPTQETGSIMFYSNETATFNAYTPLNNIGCYGTFTFNIDSVI